MSKFSDGLTTYEWEGDLTELTEVTVTADGSEPRVVRLGSLIAMSNGAILDTLDAAGVTIAEDE